MSRASATPGRGTSTCEDLVTAPGFLRRERSVQRQIAAVIDLPLAFERVVAQRAVEGGQGQVAEGMHEALVHLAGVLAKAFEVLAPLLA